MTKQSFTIIIIIFCFLISCSKSTENKLFIRIQNTSAASFKEVITNGKSFTNVDAFEITPYEPFDKAVTAAAALLISGNDTLNVGIYFTDPPVTYLPNGKYTLQIYDDTTAYYGYNCKYIKN